MCLGLSVIKQQIKLLIRYLPANISINFLLQMWYAWLVLEPSSTNQSFKDEAKVDFLLISGTMSTLLTMGLKISKLEDRMIAKLSYLPLRIYFSFENLLTNTRGEDRDLLSDSTRNQFKTRLFLNGILRISPFFSTFKKQAGFPFWSMTKNLPFLCISIPIEIFLLSLVFSDIKCHQVLRSGFTPQKRGSPSTGTC